MTDASISSATSSHPCSARISEGAGSVLHFENTLANKIMSHCISLTAPIKGWTKTMRSSQLFVWNADHGNHLDIQFNVRLRVQTCNWGPTGKGIRE